jgi:hypothetical protein
MSGPHDDTSHHVPNCRARLGLVKGLRVDRVASTARCAADALDEALRRAPSLATT